MAVVIPERTIGGCGDAGPVARAAPEFGHVGIIGNGFCLDTWGVGPFVITVGAKSYRFEDSDRFGPSLIKKNGDIRENAFPPERSPFWRAHWLWVRQRRETGPDGFSCIWREPRPNLLKVERRQVHVIQYGEPDGLDVVVAADGRFREIRFDGSWPLNAAAIAHAEAMLAAAPVEASPRLVPGEGSRDAP